MGQCQGQAKARHVKAKACQGQGTTCQRKARQGMPRPCHAKLPIASLSRNALNGAMPRPSQGKACQAQGMPRPRHDMLRQGKACQGQGTTWQGKTHGKPMPWHVKARFAKATTCQRKARQSKARHAKVSEGHAKRRQVRKNTKCRMGSLTKFWGKVKLKRRGRDESKRRRAESQWIVAARPLCHLQYPVAYLSRLQRILPAAR